MIGVGGLPWVLNFSTYVELISTDSAVESGILSMRKFLL